MKFTLRSATNEDRHNIETLVFGVLAEYGLQPDPNGTDSDLHDITKSYLENGGLFDVLLNEHGKIVGSIALFAMPNHTCELRKMYLHPTARGLGHGRRLLDHALLRAAELGFLRVTLETASALKEAIALYERYGFKPYTPDHLAGRCDRAYALDLVEKGEA